MPNNSLSYPKVCKRNDGKYYVDFKLNNKRYRLFSGRLIGSSLNPNSYPAKQRYSVTSTLAKQVHEYLILNHYSFEKPKSNIEEYDKLISIKLNQPLSNAYRDTLKYYASLLREELIKNGSITASFVDSIPLRYSNNTSFNTVKRHLNVVINHLSSHGFSVQSPRLKTRKQEEVLHSPIKDINKVLCMVKEYNYNLYVCCLLTYGCLLRPHHEIRLLRWRDFSEDLSHINLSGERVKSKRNRIVPVAPYIRDVLQKRELDHNIFTGTTKPFNKSYFSLLWRRFKKQSHGVESSMTIYSFRHTGALEIFKRTGSITKLQKAMGHSSIKVSLTYLRGLEVPELNEEDMPMI